MSGGKITQCPFRATLQAQGVHTSTAMTSCPATAQQKSPAKDDGSKDGCQCVAEGLQPKGVVYV